MTEQTNNEELIIWLRDRIMQETSKPEGEIDSELVSDYLSLLSMLVGDEYAPSKEEIKAMVDRITSQDGTAPKKTKKPTKLKGPSQLPPQP